MDSCDNLQAISAHHDRELPPDRARQLEQHLRQCDACRQELARLEALSGWLSTAPTLEIPASAVDRLRHSVKPERDRVVLRTARALTAAAAAVLVVCSVQLWRQGRSDQAPPGWEQAAVVTPSASSETVQDADLQLVRSILDAPVDGGGYSRE